MKGIRHVRPVPLYLISNHISIDVARHVKTNIWTQIAEPFIPSCPNFTPYHWGLICVLGASFSFGGFSHPKPMPGYAPLKCRAFFPSSHSSLLNVSQCLVLPMTWVCLKLPRVHVRWYNICNISVRYKYEYARPGSTGGRCDIRPSWMITDHCYKNETFPLVKCIRRYV